MSHIKIYHKNIDLAGGINLRSRFPDKEVKEESEYYKYHLIYCKLKAKGIDIDKLLEGQIVKYFLYFLIISLALSLALFQVLSLALSI